MIYNLPFDEIGKGIIYGFLGGLGFSIFAAAEK
jgi:RsiW-degrading membrane proteinase PrsW (M82 family)